VTALLVILALAVVGAAFSFKDLFIAATVDGMPISRLSVIRELEKNSGQQALDIIITKKLIEAETAKAGISVSEADIEAEIKTIEDQVSKQGGTLEMALAQQGITEEQFREQLVLQKKLEKILADKIQVTDEEVNQYLAQSKTPVPAGTNEAEFKDQIRDQLKNQKFNVEADKWITSIKGGAAVRYYVDYGKPAPTPVELPSDSQSQ
jgi:foldase protein PrsA